MCEATRKLHQSKENGQHLFSTKVWKWDNQKSGTVRAHRAQLSGGAPET